MESGLFINELKFIVIFIIKNQLMYNKKVVCVLCDNNSLVVDFFCLKNYIIVSFI